MTTSEVFNFTEIPVIDNGIERCEDSEYEPIVGTNINFGDIRIVVREQNLFSLPTKAYLLFEGQLVKLSDGSAFADADQVALTNNGIMQLFSKITYQLGNQDIESIYYPGQATTMLGLLNYSNDFQLAQGLNQLWCKDTASTAVATDNTGFATRQQYIIKSPTTNGTFSFCVPLRHIFGFCDDYDKVIYGLKHTIILTRQSDSSAIFRLSAAAAGKVNLTKIALFIPSVKPSFEEEKKIDNEIKRKVEAPLSFRMRQCDTTTVQQANSFGWQLSCAEIPRYVIVGFQTNRNAGDQTVNSALFDHCDLKNIYVVYNNSTIQYPALDYYCSFPNQQFSRIYRDASMFKERFYGMNEMIANSNITPSNYKDLYPIFVFDVSKQSEKLKSATVQLQVKAFFNTTVPANTQAYAIVISDKMMKLVSDGNKFDVK
ncbi:uncharacterized protein LOC136076291 [Hydra vulgaris]|uniref:Uncharacterized protein LOC136076291 n=1 Tax=Hydra vulgaris TaxID=6087 RepID=A0ABM4BAA2_HYDVU